MNIESLWDQIIDNEGQAFYTVTNIEFTYEVVGNAIITSRTNYKIAKSNFEKALGYMPISKPSIISKHIIGSSYVFAILTKLIK